MTYAYSNHITVPYLTADKRYAVREDDGNSFRITDDEGEPLFCLWQQCAHLDEGCWSRIETASKSRTRAADTRAINRFAAAVEARAFEGSIPVLSDDPEEQIALDAAHAEIAREYELAEAALRRRMR